MGNTVFWIATRVSYSILFLTVAPFVLPLSNFFASFCFFIYKNYKKLNGRHQLGQTRQFWHKPLSYLARFWYYFGKVAHGYEIVGLDKIPDQGPAIIVMYHAEAPYDGGFFLSEIFLQKKRKIVQVVDHVAFKIPGYQSFVEATEQTTGTVDSLTDMLSNNELIGIYPGGTREGLLGDNNYQVIWKTTAGFAKVAIKAKVPVIPVFTKNSRQIAARLPYFKDYFRHLYLTKKYMYVPIFGWFPVKLTSYVAEPIFYEESRSVEDLVQITKSSMEELIRKHQRVPGSCLMGVLDRVGSFSRKND